MRYSPGSRSVRVVLGVATSKVSSSNSSRRCHARRAVVQLDPNGRRVERGDGKLGALIEPDCRGAERKLRPSAGFRDEAITRNQRSVGKGRGRRFLRGMERHLAFDIAQARDALRRIERLSQGEARCRERQYQQGAGQHHGNSIISLWQVNGG